VTVDVQASALCVFKGSENELLTPPDYPPEQAADHRQAWKSWMETTPTIYRINPQLMVSLETGEPDLVVLQNVEVKVYKRVPVGTATLIQAYSQGGGISGYTVIADTTTGRTHYSSQATGESGNMPPGAIQVNKLNYQGVEVNLYSERGFLYEGSVTLTYTINGKNGTYSTGTPAQPLRWTIIGNGEFGGNVTEAADTFGSVHGWSESQKRWIKDFDPFNPPQ